MKSVYVMSGGGESKVPTDPPTVPPTVPEVDSISSGESVESIDVLSDFSISSITDSQDNTTFGPGYSQEEHTPSFGIGSEHSYQEGSSIGAPDDGGEMSIGDLSGISMIADEFDALPEGEPDSNMPSPPVSPIKRGGGGGESKTNFQLRF